MEIKTLGLTGLLVKTKHSTIIIDPLSKDTGAKGMPNKADIVCVSRPGSAYCDVSRIKETYLIDKPGEYEVGGVMVFARPIVQGGELGIVYQVFIDDIAILHLGGLKKKPKNGLLEELNLVDILVVPVGGMFSLDAKTAKAITERARVALVHFFCAFINFIG